MRNRPHSWRIMQSAQVHRLLDHGAEHVSRQNSGVGVETRAMIAVEEIHARGQTVDRAMGKGRLGELATECFHCRLVGDGAERQHHAQVGKSGKARFKERPAGPHLRTRRSVGRRHAAHGVGDEDILEHQAIVGMLGIMAGCKAKGQQRVIEEEAGMVACEGPPGAIGPRKPRREADDGKPSQGITKARDRRIEPFRVALPVLGAEDGKPRAQKAIGARITHG